MDSGIEGKIVLITGGAGGIGSAAAHHLAAKGATVVLADIDRKKLNDVVSSITGAGYTARGYTIDVVDRAQVQGAVDAIVAEFGRLDVLINSAGVMYIRPITEVNAAEWEATIDLNVKGTLWGIAAALPVFMAQNAGHVINLGSVHGLKVFSPGGAVHSGSKFAIRAISEGLRAELAGQYDVRVTTVTPGAVDSGIQNKTTGTDSARLLEIYRTAIPPGAVAEAIAFAIAQPGSISLNEIVVRPTAQMI
jgi:NADP-dependent 3-hydroxy acid dehydrogenase YdfG